MGDTLSERAEGTSILKFFGVRLTRKSSRCAYGRPPRMGPSDGVPPPRITGGIRVRGVELFPGAPGGCDRPKTCRSPQTLRKLVANPGVEVLVQGTNVLDPEIGADFQLHGEVCRCCGEF